MRLLFIFLTVFSVLFVSSANQSLAADLEAGEQVFNANCSACHAGGENALIPDKTLKGDVLQENSMNSISAIKTQVRNGKNAMPSFGGRLAEEDIDNVANYVLTKSEQGW